MENHFNDDLFGFFFIRDSPFMIRYSPFGYAPLSSNSFFAASISRSCRGSEVMI